MSPAGTQSFLVDVTPGANHTVVMEDLAQPRVVTVNHCLLLHAPALAAISSGTHRTMNTYVPLHEPLIIEYNHIVCMCVHLSNHDQ